ncbi:MAG: hypothetical protein WD184_05310 [Acidimicrobiia bacterium]
MNWLWDQTDAGKIGLSGDIAKLFRHEEPKQPGVFAQDAPPAAATLLAREVIQNSWDAAIELKEQLGPSADHQFSITFEFADLIGDEKRALIEALDLAGLADRVGQIDRRSIGLGQHDCLDQLDDSGAPLSVLRILEHGATGMYGPWTQNKSHMYLALVSLGYTEKLAGAGGSYGYGKAGLINGSRIRSVIAYSCFAERQDDPGVTRRLLGMTYWGQHDIGGANFTGIGSLSTGRGGLIEPHIDDEADSVAASMGFTARSSDEVAGLGTSFLLIDPTVGPEDLRRAIERSWWPALHEGDFIIDITGADGSSHPPRPMQDETLRSFIDAWELAVGRRDARRDEWASELSGPSAASPDGERFDAVGNLGLVADLSGWSYADAQVGPEDEEVSQKSLVALTRGPRMVVEYFVAGQSPPYLRGAFSASSEIDDLLRRTEPKAHDSWRTKPSDGEVDPYAATLADHVIKRIRSAVNNHRGRLKPAVPPPEDLNLPFFNEIMRRVMSGAGKGTRQPVPEVREISIHLRQGPRESSNGLIEMEGTATFSLSDHYDGESADVEVSISYKFIEDGRVGASADLTLSAPDGAVAVGPGVYRARLDRESTIAIGFCSEPYDPRWSGRLFANAEITKVAHSGIATE